MNEGMNERSFQRPTPRQQTETTTRTTDGRSLGPESRVMTTTTMTAFTSASEGQPGPCTGGVYSVLSL